MKKVMKPIPSKNMVYLHEGPSCAHDVWHIFVYSDGFWMCVNGGPRPCYPCF